MTPSLVRRFNSVEHDGLSSVHQDPPFDVTSNSPRQYQLLEVASFSYQIVDAVTMPDSDDILLDDGALIEILRRIMGRRADDLHAPFVCLSVGIGPDKSRKERMVDIDHWAADLRQKFRTEDLHVAGHHDQLHTRFLKDREDLFLLLRLGLFRDGEHRERDFEKVCPAGTGIMIRNDDRDLDVELIASVPLEQIG